MKTRVWIYMQNNGDGSSSPIFFRSEENAEKYASNHYERNCDDIDWHDLEFDENGLLLNGSDDEIEE